MTALMTLLDPLWTRLLDSGTETVVYECRDCGTSLDGERDPCPNCGSEDVARHDLS